MVFRQFRNPEMPTQHLSIAYHCLGTSHMEGRNPGKPKWRGIFRASYAPYLGKYPSTFLEISTVSVSLSSIIGM
jgi:hypothetical protein